MRVLEPMDKFKKLIKEARKYRAEVESIKFEGFEIIFRPIEKPDNTVQNKEVVPDATVVERIDRLQREVDMDELMISNPLEYERRLSENSNG